ncbi:hypothetical protein G7Y89_g9080 [Cudoniella acicularis]|uniref:Uncharacterized protein n=1 Tax=Cudoniella acicularis TaxID=354080 RepID=A0A8H4RJ25_9HELO|nr:hypothetical protein G7Y89_g9080 [Cudoniella acicularis]
MDTDDDSVFCETCQRVSRPVETFLNRQVKMVRGEDAQSLMSSWVLSRISQVGNGADPVEIYHEYSHRIGNVPRAFRVAISSLEYILHPSAFLRSGTKAPTLAEHSSSYTLSNLPPQNSLLPGIPTQNKPRLDTPLDSLLRDLTRRLLHHIRTTNTHAFHLSYRRRRSATRSSVCRLQISHLELPNGGKDANAGLNGISGSSQTCNNALLTIKLSNGLDISANRSSPLKEGVWGTRAWTFQEGLFEARTPDH